MATTILELAKSALYDIGIIPPASLISTTDNTQLQLKNIVYQQSKFLRNQRIFPQCKKQFTFSTSNARIVYPLPEDFYSALYRTQWDTTAQWEMLGPISDAEYNFRRYGISVTGPGTAYRIFGPDMNKYTAGGQFQINPAPGTTPHVLSFEYITKNLFLPPDWTPSTVIAASSYRNANGLIFFTTAGGTTSTTPPAAAGADGTVTWTVVTAPYETVITDTDLSLFDDDIMIAGIKYRYQISKGLDYTEAKKEHDDLVDSANARWNGNYVVRLDQSEYVWGRPNLPEGSWG